MVSSTEYASIHFLTIHSGVEYFTERFLDKECELNICDSPEGQLFFEGNKVHHNHFGDGTEIKAYDNGEFCEVDFESFGVRAIKSDKLSLL